jgi:hypothetical protein
MHHGEFRDDRSREDDFSYGGWNRHPIGNPDGEFLVARVPLEGAP